MSDILKLENFPHITTRETKSLRANPDNAKDHGDKQIRKIAASIERFGFLSPIVIDENGRIAAGHGRWEAAKLLGLKTIPVHPGPIIGRR